MWWADHAENSSGADGQVAVGLVLLRTFAATELVAAGMRNIDDGSGIAMDVYSSAFSVLQRLSADRVEFRLWYCGCNALFP